MGRSRFKWKCVFISYLALINVFAKSLPILDTKLSALTTTDTIFKNSDGLLVTEVTEELTTVHSENAVEGKNYTDVKVAMNGTRDSQLRNIRPGQEVRRYAIELTDNGNSFSGRAILDIILSQATRGDPIELHAEGLRIQSVKAGVFTDASAVNVEFDHDDGILEISPDISSSSFVVIIEYTGNYVNSGRGFHRGQFGNDGTYLAMNLHPTFARSVFPCMDEPTEVSVINFTFNNIEYNNLVSNSMLEENSANQFRALQGPPHLWGMVAHNFNNINIPINQVILYGRPGLTNQDALASAAINFFFTNLNEWTGKPYFEIVLNQDGRMHIIAVPDIAVEWHALSTVMIWDGHVFMETSHSIKQRKTALFEIAQAMAKQWFGYVIFPENWRYEWVVSGLASYTAYEMMKLFQSTNVGTDITLLDVNTLFVTDVIQESLLRDAYEGAQVLEPEDDLFDEEDVRDHVRGLLKYKAPALMRMMRVVLGNPDQDFIRSAARALLNGRALQTVNSLNFVDAINSEWLSNGNNNVPDVGEYLEDWIFTTGYPLLHVGLRQGGVLITQERFGFTNQVHASYLIPITYTTRANPDFNNFQPVMMTDATATLNFQIGGDDWVLFNIQGQAYYRVNYDAELWDRIIDALEDPEAREQIHPLNRATLVDDALNIARAGKIDYDIALRVVLTMELETEYAVWKAFVRNMEFLRKRLIALVTEDDDLDQDIYLRMVRRTIGAIEDELGFSPDVSLSEPSMQTLTRGLVMEHACKANYQPCIAAAVDWFYESGSGNSVVNPNIPHEIRPAVFCTMVREGGDDIIEALFERLNVENTLYERVVILQSLACSQDDVFIRRLLEETLAVNGPYSVEERSKIFIAVAESSYENALIALEFLSRNTARVRNMYGGPEKLEELLFVLADNIAENGLANDFRIWVNSQQNNLGDSEAVAHRALRIVEQDINWIDANLEAVYEWIDENDATTTMVSIVALCVSVMVALFNH